MVASASDLSESHSRANPRNWLWPQPAGARGRARGAGPTAVVAVRSEIADDADFAAGKNLAEFMAIGTAVRHRRGGSWRTPAGRPFTSERVQYEAQQVASQGVVGVQIVEKNHVWGHHAIEFFAIGTAVTRYRDGGATLRPRMVLTLDD